ncbi:WGR domain-containing protein [Nonomuraea sp. NPDC050536]|uniref:WGR domain-containing protein n=1 Tax=Nonomuraea sp. NPDC050536 TaxID=3364366 RepID=UPI0037C948B3
MSADRMLTYVGAGSAKFWEVRQNDTELNIRYGRLGATGQAQVKSFDSAADAAEAADKLVAEKLRKGYKEDEAVAPLVISVGDEDRLTMPTAWLRSLHPRRGGAKVAVKRLDTGAPKELAARLDERRQLILDSLAECRDPEIASAGAAYLAGEPTAAPLGAAVVVQAVAASLSWADRTLLPLFAEAWLAERGLVFAAVAVTELASLDQALPVRRLAAGESANHWFGWNWMEVATRVRAALVTASDAEYAEVVAALAESREGGLHHQVAASYLAPTETDWVAADCAEVNRVNPALARGLVAAISTPEHAALIVSHVQGHSVMHSLALPATVVDGMGDAAVPVLTGWFDEVYDAESQRRLLGMLAELPTDTAMQALLDRIEHKYTEPAFLRAAARFPRRAMRMLANSGGKAVDLLLRAHVLAHPDLVAEVLASVGDAAAERINKIVTAATVATAPLEALPEVLVSPPWTRPRTARKPVVVSDLVCADEPTVVWGPGERDNWRSVRPGQEFFAGIMLDACPAAPTVMACV